MRKNSRRNKKQQKKKTHIKHFFGEKYVSRILEKSQKNLRRPHKKTSRKTIPEIIERNEKKTSKKYVTTKTGEKCLEKISTFDLENIHLSIPSLRTSGDK